MSPERQKALKLEESETPRGRLDLNRAPGDEMKSTQKSGGSLLNHRALQDAQC